MTMDFDVDSLFPGYTDRLFQLESNNGKDPRSMDASAKNRGLGQFGREEERRYGITDWTDPAQQRRAVNLEAADHYKILSNALGRPPTAPEMYFTHQQGPGGGPALLTADPSQPAWMAVRSKYSDDGTARRAIGDNILGTSPLLYKPQNQITAGDFWGMWRDKWNGGPQNPALAGTGLPQPAAIPGLDPRLAQAAPGLAGVGDAEAAATAAAQTGATGSSNPLVGAGLGLLKGFQQQPLQPAQMNLLSGPRGPNMYLQKLMQAMQENPLGQPQSGSPEPT